MTPFLAPMQSKETLSVDDVVDSVAELSLDDSVKLDTCTVGERRRTRVCRTGLRTCMFLRSHWTRAKRKLSWIFTMPRMMGSRCVQFAWIRPSWLRWQPYTGVDIPIAVRNAHVGVTWSSLNNEFVLHSHLHPALGLSQGQRRHMPAVQGCLYAHHDTPETQWYPG